MSKRDFPPITPGEVLEEEFLKPMGLSQYRLAKENLHPPDRYLVPTRNYRMRSRGRPHPRPPGTG